MASARQSHDFGSGRNGKFRVWHWSAATDKTRPHRRQAADIVWIHESDPTLWGTDGSIG